VRRCAESREFNYEERGPASRATHGEIRDVAPRGSDTTEGTLVLRRPPHGGSLYGETMQGLGEPGEASQAGPARAGDAWGASCRPAGAGKAVPGARLRVPEDGSIAGKGSTSSDAFGARGVHDPGGPARGIPQPPRAHAWRPRTGTDHAAAMQREARSTGVESAEAGASEQLCHLIAVQPARTALGREELPHRTKVRGHASRWRDPRSP